MIREQLDLLLDWKKVISQNILQIGLKYENGLEVDFSQEMNNLVKLFDNIMQVVREDQKEKDISLFHQCAYDFSKISSLPFQIAKIVKDFEYYVNNSNE